MQKSYFSDLNFVSSLKLSDEDSEDPCEEFHCAAGSECVIEEETKKPKCECIEECGYEENPRRMVRKSHLYCYFSKHVSLWLFF